MGAKNGGRTSTRYCPAPTSSFAATTTSPAASTWRWSRATCGPSSSGCGCWIWPRFGLGSRKVRIFQIGSPRGLEVEQLLALVDGLPDWTPAPEPKANGHDTSPDAETPRTGGAVISLVAKRSRKKPIRRDDNDPRPTIRITAGDIERIVDEAEDALIKSNRGLYQRGNQIVAIGHAPALAAHGREIVTQRIFDRGEHALLEDLAASARFEKYDARAKDYVTSDPPMAIVKTLQQRTGRLRFPILAGVINAPTMRADGSILDAPGYDAVTGLLFDPAGVEFPAVLMNPTRADAQEALAPLGELIERFPFVAEQDCAVALSAILTACIRRSLPTSPLHAFTAPVAGSGKSLKLVDIASVISASAFASTGLSELRPLSTSTNSPTMIATGHEASVMAQGQTEEELEKRLATCRHSDRSKPPAAALLGHLLVLPPAIFPVFGC